MAKLTIEGNAVQIKLSTMDKLWAMHGDINIPLAHIKGARVEDEDGWQYIWRKIIGANAPGLKTAGIFYLKDGLAFLDFGAGRNCVVLDTQHERYKRVIVEVDGDPDALVADLNRRIGKT